MTATTCAARKPPHSPKITGTKSPAVEIALISGHASACCHHGMSVSGANAASIATASSALMTPAARGMACGLSTTSSIQ